MSFDNDVELRKVAAVYPEAQLLLRVVCEEGSMDWIGLEVFVSVFDFFSASQAIEQSAIRLGVGDQRHTWKYGTYEKPIYKEYVSHKQEGHRTYVMSMFFLFNACILPTLTFGIPLI